MAGRFDPNPFDDGEEVNPFADGAGGKGGKTNYSGGSFYTSSVPPATNSRLSPLPHEPADFYDRSAPVDIPLDSAADLKKKEKELQARESDLRKREEDDSIQISDDDLAELLMRDHDVFLSTLRSRLTKLQDLKKKEKELQARESDLRKREEDDSIQISDDDLAELLMRDHDVFLSTLRSRLTKLQGSRNVGIVDTEYVVHQGIQTLGGPAKKLIEPHGRSILAEGKTSVQKKLKSQQDPTERVSGPRRSTISAVQKKGKKKINHVFRPWRI